MEYIRLINILPIGIFIFALLALPAMAATHSMTGDMMTDWGVDLSKAYAEDSTHVYTNPNGWIPTSSDVDFVVENNIDHRFLTDSPFSTDPAYTWAVDWAKNRWGTHLTRHGGSSTIDTYQEPPTSSGGRTYVQPAGGEAYDLEALYFDDDDTNIYIALVTSVKPGGNNGDNNLGDIALDIDNNGNYEYGVNTTAKSTSDTNQTLNGTIVDDPNWRNSDYFTTSDPYKIKSALGTSGQGTVKSYKLSQSETEERITYPKYLVEATLPKTAFENISPDKLSNLHMTITCGNDEIELLPVKFKHNIPEFPSIVLPIAAIMGIIVILGRRNKD